MLFRSLFAQFNVLDTSGALNGIGDLDPALKAFDDKDGKLLWSAPLDADPSSIVITYSVGQTQYVAVVTGMSNFHIGAMRPRYQKFRAANGLPALTPPTGTPCASRVTFTPEQTAALFLGLEGGRGLGGRRTGPQGDQARSQDAGSCQTLKVTAQKRHVVLQSVFRRETAPRRRPAPLGPL